MSLRSVALLLAVPCAAAGIASAGEKCRRAPARTSAEFLARGPYAVGRSTLTFVDTSRPTPASGTCAAEPARTLVTEVWFPATSAGGAFLDPSGAPYPLIAHSHGLLDFRTGEAYLAEHLASWGYVVTSADFPLTNTAKIGCIRLADIENQPGDVSFVIDSVLAELGGAIDAARIGASGLSLGGATTLLVTYHATVRDGRIRASLPIAPVGCMTSKLFFAATDVPLLLLAGTSDILLPYRQNAKRPFRAAQAPKYLVSLRDASHTGFAGPFATQPGTPHPDGVGCAFIEGVVPDGSDPNDDPFAGLEGEGTGVESSLARCPLPCQRTLPPSAMPPATQHDLTRITAVAFFQGTLRGDLGARCFLRKGFAKEQREVSVGAR
jgi:dienelactone hydrolase